MNEMDVKSLTDTLLFIIEVMSKLCVCPRRVVECILQWLLLRVCVWLERENRVGEEQTTLHIRNMCAEALSV